MLWARAQRHGKVRSIRVGEVLFREGDATYDVMVLLEGRVALWRSAAATLSGGVRRKLPDPNRSRISWAGRATRKLPGESLG